MIRLSIIIPFYGVEKYIGECLYSIFHQDISEEEYEVICINDRSPDNCANILAEYADKDQRIKVFTQNNQGLSVARNNGLKYATGKYIYFLDSDDCIHPQTLEISHYFITQNNADMVCFDFVKNADNTMPKTALLNVKDIKFKITNNPLYLDKMHTNVWTKLYKKNLLQGISFAHGIRFEDVPFVFSVLSKNPKTVILSEKLYFYTINEESFMHAKSNASQIKDYHKAIIIIAETYNKEQLLNEYKFIINNYIPSFLKQQYNRCRRADKITKPEMFKAFAEELRDLKAKGMLSWHGHKLTRYLKYLWIMRIY